MLATTARARVLACRGGSSAVSVNRRLPRLTAPGWPSVRQASQQARRDRDSSAALHVATCSSSSSSSSSSKCYALLYALASCSANQLSITSCVVCGAWPFLVGGVICLVNSVNERDLNLLTSTRISNLRYFLEGLCVVSTWKFEAITGL